MEPLLLSGNEKAGLSNCTDCQSDCASFRCQEILPLGKNQVCCLLLP